MRALAIGGDGEAIPRIFHQVWVGSTVPNWVQERWAAWREALQPSGWDVRQWTDETYWAWPGSKQLRERCAHPVVLADLVRLEVVSLLGGVYMDSDSWPLRPIDSLVGDRAPWVGGYLYEDGRMNMGNGAFAFPPRHSVLAEVWAEAERRVREGRYLLYHYYAGPPVWNLVAGGRVELLPSYVLAPGVWRDRRKLQELHKDLDKARRLFPNSLAFHELEQSWNPKTKAGHA